MEGRCARDPEFIGDADGRYLRREPGVDLVSLDIPVEVQ